MSVVTLSVNDSTRGTVSGGGTFDVGTQVTVAATASSGYVFACWCDGSRVVSANGSYTFTVSEDVTLTAYFYSEVDSVKVYGFCDAKCRHIVLSIGQVISLVQEMAANGFQVPTEFTATTPINAIIEQNTGLALQVFVGTTKEWESWTGDKTRTLSFLTDGTGVVEEATHAEVAEYAEAVNPFALPLIANVTYNYDGFLTWYKANKGVDFNFIPYIDEQGNCVYPLVPCEHGLVNYHCNRQPQKGDVFTLVGTLNTDNGKNIFRLICEINEQGISADGTATAYSFYITDYTLLHDASLRTLDLKFVPEFPKPYAEIQADYNNENYDYTNDDDVYSIWYGHWSKRPTVGELFTSVGTSSDGYVFGFKGRVVKATTAIWFALDDLVLYHDPSKNASTVNGIAIAEDLEGTPVFSRRSGETVSYGFQKIEADNIVYYKLNTGTVFIDSGAAVRFYDTTYGEEILIKTMYDGTPALKGKVGGALHKYFGEAVLKFNISFEPYNAVRSYKPIQKQYSCSSITVGTSTLLGAAPYGKTKEDITSISFRAGGLYLQGHGAVIHKQGFAGSNMIGVDRDRVNGGSLVGGADIVVSVSNGQVYLTVKSLYTMSSTAGAVERGDGDEISISDGGVYITFS